MGWSCRPIKKGLKLKPLHLDNKNTNQESPSESSGKKGLSLARKAGIFTISRAVTIVAQLLAIVILTRSLPKEDYAVVSFLLVIWAIGIA